MYNIRILSSYIENGNRIYNYRLYASMEQNNKTLVYSGSDELGQIMAELERVENEHFIIKDRDTTSMM